MAKKRDLKRLMNYISSDLLAEAMAASLYNTTADQQAVDDLLSAIIIMRNDFVKRISHPEPGMTAHAYYKELVSKFNDTTSDIIDKIGSLG